MYESVELHSKIYDPQLIIFSLLYVFLRADKVKAPPDISQNQIRITSKSTEIH